jgi:ABC-type ATPase with predicted acetyltransferase domain
LTVARSRVYRHRMDSAQPADAMLRLHGVVLELPGVRALDQVDLDVRQGGVHCLLGHNGTGKSTLIKVLSGAHRSDAGRITWFGDEVSFANPQAAVRAGIATVYQELDLVEGLSVADNVFLGAEPRRLGSPNVDRCARPRGRCRPGSGTARCPCSARSRSCRRRPHRSSAWPGRRPSTRGCSAWTFFIDRREGS